MELVSSPTISISTPAKTDKVAANILKGVAISAVILLHTLSSLPAETYTTSPNRNFFIVIDQLCRFSVPLFIALSGYGLAKRYQHKHPGLREFFQRRVLKLLPLYILWSGVLFFLFSLELSWQVKHETVSIFAFLKKLWQGGVDYHLYFVPLIFQMYVIFPLIFFLQARKDDRKKLVILGGGFALQLAAFMYFAQFFRYNPDLPFSTDQKQYSSIFSWIFYFIQGIFFAQVEISRKRKEKLAVLFAVAATAGVTMAILQPIQKIELGYDPLMALRFTRLPIFLYVGSLISLLFLSLHRIAHIPKIWSRLLSIIGEHSYLIFLAHTLGLRIVFGYLEKTVSTQMLLFSSIILLITFYGSKRLSK